MSEETKHRDLSFVRDYNLKVGDYKETSGLIKDGLYSWHLCDDNKTYTIESAFENRIHEMRIESRHMIVFSYHSKSLISKDGFFYNKFDCEEYDWIERIYSSEYYICRKSDKYGIIDDEGNVIIDIVYPLITRLPKIVDIDIDEIYWYEPPHIRKHRKEELGENTKPYLIVKITTYDGEYLLELTSGHKSKIYDKIYTFGKNYLIESKGLYGLLSRMGEEVVPPQYAKAWPFDKTMFDWSIDERYRTGGWIEVEMDGRKVPIANNGKYYGEIPLEYNECRRLERGYYSVTKNNKKGVLFMGLSGLSTYVPVKYDNVLLDPYQPFNVVFAIVHDEEGYKLLDVRKGTLSEPYQSLAFTFDIGLSRVENYSRMMGYAPYFIAQKNNKYALLSQKGIPLTNFEYQSIKPMLCNIFPVCKNDKWGVLNKKGESLIACEWDRLVNISNGEITVEKSGEKRAIKLDDVYVESGHSHKPSCKHSTYGRYAGTYAQDEMGYSDDDIDTIFDGDPSAYWNID